MLKCFVVNSQPHRAFRLWLALCAAAAQDAASPGSCNAVLSLLHAKPPPLMWQPEMAVAAALAGGCQDEFELGLPVEVQRTAAASKLERSRRLPTVRPPAGDVGSSGRRQLPLPALASHFAPCPA